MTATAYERVVDALHERGFAVKERSGKADAQCPAHGSVGLKLAISGRRDSTGAVVHCWTGCDPVDVMAALGMMMRDLYDSKTPAGYVPRPPPNPLGDPDHFCDRILQQEKLEATGEEARRVAELEQAAKPREGDYPGGWVE
jgi:hypothetical protein